MVARITEGMGALVSEERPKKAPHICINLISHSPMPPNRNHDVGSPLRHLAGGVDLARRAVQRRLGEQSPSIVLFDHIQHSIA